MEGTTLKHYYKKLKKYYSENLIYELSRRLSF